MKKLIAAAALCSALPLFAKITTGAPFSDGAVLQRGMDVPVWGMALPSNGGKKPDSLKVEFAGQEKIAKVAADGAWKVSLSPMEASKESRTMKLSALADGTVLETREIKDVLVGEVWFASGQSNMECPIWGPRTRYRDANGGLMTTMTSLPCVRYVKCERKWSVKPSTFAVKWNKFTPESLQLFGRADKSAGVQLSAVAFYYARELYLALGIPIGIVDASWGGTNIDAWTPRSGYKDCDASITATADYAVKANWNGKTDRIGPINANHQQPTVLFNGMVSTFAPMAMRGFIWYQGCTNGGEPQLYCAKLHALYEGWRREFSNPELKF